MKKQPPPKLSKAELKAEALKMLSSGKSPEEAVEWLLDQFTGWDLEAIIERLRK